MSGLPRRSSTRSDRRRSGSCYSDSIGPRPRERHSRRFEKPRATAASSANECEDLTATLETNERKTTTAAAVASCSIPRGADALLPFLGPVRVALHGLCIVQVAIDGLRIGAAFRGCGNPVPVLDGSFCLFAVSHLRTLL